MLEEKDIQRLIEVFVTKAEFREAIDGLATKADINQLLGPFVPRQSEPRP